MQAGRQKAALPLIRRFNEHSERLLKSALFVAFVSITPVRLTEGMFHSGDGPSAKRRRLNDPIPVDVGRATCIKYYPVLIVQPSDARILLADRTRRPKRLSGIGRGRFGHEEQPAVLREPSYQRGRYIQQAGGAAGFRVSKRSRLNPVQVSVPQAFSELRGCLGGWERSLTQVLPASSGGSDGFH